MPKCPNGPDAQGQCNSKKLQMKGSAKYTQRIHGQWGKGPRTEKKGENQIRGKRQRKVTRDVKTTQVREMPITPGNTTTESKNFSVRIPKMK